MNWFKRTFSSGKEAKDTSSSEKVTGDNQEQAKAPPTPDLRKKNVAICTTAGFRPASSLPTEWDRNLQPAHQIAGRLNAIKALVLWLMVPQDELPSDDILHFVLVNDLRAVMTEEEEIILESPRDDADLRNMIGWKFENAWPLAWYFGFNEPEIAGQMMTGEQMQEILVNYSCPLSESVDDWAKEQTTRSKSEVIAKEDLFYCVHNAVRSAQMGSNTVPEGFDPMGNGGVIHERRHSLTWMLSDGIEWDETDLST